ncbi:MAG: PEP-CTERM sorting domain-containing protein [Phycisphaerae bacterium]|nr:PEP-CTERM sorting domain-containing protein [Phycisphaerae bacterium]
MRVSLTLTTFLLAALTSPMLADTVTPQQVLTFGPADGSAGEWYYNGAGVMSFDQDIVVDSGLASNYDALVGARVYLPTFQVSGIPDAPYTLTPLGSSEITIRSADNSVTYMTGTLTISDLTTVGTVAGAYTQFQADITDVFITHEGSALGSSALEILENLSVTSLDFDLSFTGGSGSGYKSFADMLDRGGIGSGGFSGSMSIPEPATIILLGLSGLTLVRKRRT